MTIFKGFGPRIMIRYHKHFDILISQHDFAQIRTHILLLVVCSTGYSHSATGSMSNWFYVLLVLYSTSSMFYWFYVLLVLCSTGSMFYWFYVLMVLCSTGSIFYWFFVLLVLCSTGSMFYWFYVLLVLCSTVLCSTDSMF